MRRKKKDRHKIEARKTDMNVVHSCYAQKEFRRDVKLRRVSLSAISCMGKRPLRENVVCLVFGIDRTEEKR